MTPFWTAFVVILTVGNIAACLWLLWWTARRRSGDKPDTSTTGHVWDEDLTEYNKPLPRWWLNLFYATIAFSVGYLVLYPGLGAFGGTLGWSQQKKHAEDVAAADAKIAPLYAKYGHAPVDALARDPAAVQLGRSVFANNCATCHGSDARGAKGFPNLVDADWLWGGDPDTVLKTILDGRTGAMPPLGEALGPRGTSEVAVYVRSLSGQAGDPVLAAAGQKHFAMLCAACHGADAKGNTALGAPNLTDSTWLHGGSFQDVSDTIRLGRTGTMPAHGAIVGEARARLAAAYVLSRGADAGAHPPDTGSK